MQFVRLHAFDKLVNEIITVDFDDLKNNLRELQEQFVLQLLQVFENISFTNETEEIIDFVDESSFAIKSELETLQNEIHKISGQEDSVFFNEHFNNLCDLVTKQSNNEFNLYTNVYNTCSLQTCNNFLKKFIVSKKIVRLQTKSFLL